MKTRVTLRSVSLNAVLIVISTLAILIFAESAYRVRLAALHPEPSDQLPAVLGLQDQSFWEFDREFGFVYPPNRAVSMFWVGPNGVIGCDSLKVNAYGNMGRIKGNYASASLKILVFGDSFSAISFNGMTWPDYLQDRLEEQLKRSVHVVNFGRDGYGILQMFDLAKAKVSEWHPDAVIFAFSTDDLTRARIWRTVVEVDGMTRVLVTKTPDPQPEIRNSADVYLLYPPATVEWCKAMAGTGRRDHHLERIEQIYHRIRLDHLSPPAAFHANIYALDRSYLYHRIRFGNPFIPLFLSPSQNPRLQCCGPGSFADFSDDEKFRAAVTGVEAQSVPFFIVHLPFYPEYVANRYLLNNQEFYLRESLERATKRPIISLLDKASPPLKDPERLRNTKVDFHPSPEGQKLYAEQIAKQLIQKLNLRSALSVAP